MSYQKHYWLEHKLPDGNIWKGWINLFSTCITDLPKEIFGTYWFEKTSVGWRGYFWLNNQTERDAVSNNQFVVTAGIWRPEVTFKTPPMSMQEAEARLRYLEEISSNYTVIPKITCRIENSVILSKCHVMEY